MTILGHHTAAEVRELVAAKDFENAKMVAAYDALANKDLTDVQIWKADWDLYAARYASAKIFAQKTLAIADATGVNPKNYPTEDAWVKLLQAESKVSLGDKILGNTAEGPYKRGDKQDLYNRLLVLRNYKQVDFTGLPQPKPGTDTDFNAYKSAGDMLGAVDRAINPTKNPWPYVLAGLGILVFGAIAFAPTINTVARIARPSKD